MTRIKLCGLSRECEILAADELLPEYVGFVFWPKSRRYVSPEKAESFRKILAPEIQSVGVFVDEDPENIAELTRRGIIDIIQLHGHEDGEYISILRTLIGENITNNLHGHENNTYISGLRTLAGKTIIKAFTVKTPHDIDTAQNTTADYIMLDSGMGTGESFCWKMVRDFSRPYFLAGGLTPENVAYAVNELKPFAVDVSSGIETHGVKDIAKMAAFVEAVRGSIVQ